MHIQLRNRNENVSNFSSVSSFSTLAESRRFFSKRTSTGAKMSLRFAFNKLAGKSALGLGNTGAQRQFVAAGISNIKIYC